MPPGQRDASGRWQRGQSGNPGGRPRRAIPPELGAEALRIAIESLVVVIRDTRSTPAIRLRAAEQLLRRVAGRTGRVRGAAELAIAWGLMPPESRRLLPSEPDPVPARSRPVPLIRLRGP